ncbi:HlyD family efflux transporter periplasmic adaptor subunit [Marinifilum sp.]|uniref:HlyD family efflux transporter periplasmic adaptor subunit n=1 Tax=Marinifilum sp. TaxID=2033137 RepID=UPI003BAB4FBF
MSEKKENIELRSEKVRNIIGQIPSWIIRSGITVIFVVVIFLLTGSYFFHYPDKVEGKAYLQIDSIGLFFAKVNVPYRCIGKIAEGQNVNVELEGYPVNKFGLLKGNITKIVPYPLEENGESYFVVQAKLTNGMKSTQNKSIPFFPNLKGNAKITVGEQRLLDKFLSPIISKIK